MKKTALFIVVIIMLLICLSASKNAGQGQTHNVSEKPYENKGHKVTAINISQPQQRQKVSQFAFEDCDIFVFEITASFLSM